jgi:hypothetical protein
MYIDFADENNLITRLIKEDEVSFIFGSALTARINGVGIPNTTGVVEILREYVDEEGLLEEYIEHLTKTDNDNIYQASFEFIAKSLPKGSIAKVINRVVNSNIDPDTREHKITKPISDLVNLIKSEKLKVRNIITTNFDTLLEEALKKENILTNSISIVSDSNINQNNNGLINIIHIHGVWDKGDTMHTRNQLNNAREKIEASIRHLLTNNTIYIMAYSGWEDSFTRTLSTIVNDDKADYALAWCFYEKNDNDVKADNEELFLKMRDAVSHERIQFYKGIDCHTIFQNIEKKN